MKKELTVEEQLFLLAYAGIPAISDFVKKHPNLPKTSVAAATPVYFCSRLVFVMKICCIDRRAHV